MKALLTFNMVLFTLFVYGQTPQKEDLTPRHIVPKSQIDSYELYIDPNLIIAPNEWNIDLDIQDGDYIWPYYDFYPVPDLPITWNFTVGYWITPCGEQFHDNGILSSRCACNEDSVLHGKSVYWDEYGQIANVYHYWNGKLYSQKNYEDGKVTELWNYTYKNGGQQRHGQHISYNAFGKTINNYRFGNLHGEEVEYHHGHVHSKNIYNNGTLLESRTWNEEGILVREQLYDQNGAQKGVWIEFNPTSNQLVKKVHEEGRCIRKETFQHDTLIERWSYFADNSSQLERFFPDGNRERLNTYASSGETRCKSWDTQGNLTEDYQLLRGSYISDGFFRTGDETTHIRIVKCTDGSQYLHCLVTKDSDSIKEFYALNRGNLTHDVVHENRYTQIDGRSVKQGRWLIYENNNIVQETHYANGIKHGKAVYYDTLEKEPAPYLFGNYNNGKKHKEWTYRVDSLLIRYNYDHGAVSGYYNAYRRVADTVPLANNDPLPQNNREIHETLTIKFSGTLLNSQLHDYFRTHSENGTRHWEGWHKEGERHHTWKEYGPEGKYMVKLVRFNSDRSLNKKSYTLTYKGLRRGREHYKKRKLKEFDMNISIFIPRSPEEVIIQTLRSQPL